MMRQVFFKKAFDWRVDDHMTIGYSTGLLVEVEEDCAAAAVASGAADYADFAEDDLFAEHDDEGE